MKVTILPSPHDAITRTAGLIADQVRAKPASVLGLATGGTMERVYDALTSAEDVDFAGVTTFNLDEYVGLSPGDPQSYHAYMQRHLFDRVPAPFHRTHIPRGDVANLMAEAAAYEAAIHAAGGIDLQLLGIGTNGHIGFNEPDSPFDTRTRVVTLSDATRTANSRYFNSLDAVPTQAVTMGIATILSAKRIVLLAVGSGKAGAVQRMIEGSISPDCPASSLQRHHDVHVILDQAAAALLAPK
ncbi:MAG: glucosamine-6-phosphate deaminase [Paracoccus denitrificans]|nr:MAG: glucosamine-6-phosphate deaminase [Paracoccus denitrificans]PZO84103.1 MAG: glucosamine-6-phosphate deaminase [Paracoccus denitrificans]